MVQEKTLVIGITGGMGSGKSTVSHLLELMQMPVYVADNESKKLLDEDPLLQKELQKAFGEHIYDAGRINRVLFAEIIFGDAAKLKQANDIIHPCVARHFRQWLQQKQQEGVGIVGLESAILHESGFNQLVDKTLLVYAPKDLRISRVMKRTNMNAEQIEVRMDAQMDDTERLKLADVIIFNDETQSLIEQVQRLLQGLRN